MKEYNKRFILFVSAMFFFALWFIFSITFFKAFFSPAKATLVLIATYGDWEMWGDLLLFVIPCGVFSIITLIIALKDYLKVSEPRNNYFKGLDDDLIKIKEHIQS